MFVLYANIIKKRLFVNKLALILDDCIIKCRFQFVNAWQCITMY